MKQALLLFILCSITTLTFAVQPTQKLSVLLDDKINPNHAPLIIAKQQGFFLKQGLDVTLVEPRNTMSTPQSIAENKYMIGVTYEPRLMEQIDHGLPLVSIGTLIDKPLNSLVALQKNQVHTFADLKGKRIGITDGRLTHVMLATMLAQRGISESDVKLIDIHTDPTQALLQNQVDAVTGLMRNAEVPALETRGQLSETFFPEEHGVPNYSELVFITQRSHSNDDRIPRFLEAIKEAVAYLDAHPQQAWQDFAEAYPQNNSEMHHEMWVSTIPYFSEDPARQHPAEWLRFAGFMQQHHLITHVAPLSNYIIAHPTLATNNNRQYHV